MKKLEKTIIESILDKDTKESVIAIQLFGSQLSGRAQSDSDVDIAVLFKQDSIPQKMELIELREAVSDKIGKEVDLVCLNEASPIICMEVLKNGITLYLSSQKEFDRYFVNLVTDYADLKIVRKKLENDILERRFYG